MFRRKFVEKCFEFLKGQNDRSHWCKWTFRETRNRGLIEREPANQVIAAIRTPERASRFERLGVQVRTADYSRPETLSTSLRGVKRILLISAADVSERFNLHKAVIDAAKKEGELLAKSQDRVADHYIKAQKAKGVTVKPTPIAVAAAPAAAPASAPAPKVEAKK